MQSLASAVYNFPSRLTEFCGGALRAPESDLKFPPLPVLAALGAACISGSSGLHAATSTPGSIPVSAAAATAPAPLSVEDRRKLIASAESLWAAGAESGVNAIYQSLFDRDPDDALALRSQASWQFLSGRDFEAEVTARHLAKAHPDDPHGAFLLGRLALVYGRVDDALPLLTAARDSDPADPQFAIALAQAFALNARPVNAAATLRLNREKGKPEQMAGNYAMAMELTPVIAERMALIREMATALPALAVKLNAEADRFATYKEPRFNGGTLEGGPVRLAGIPVAGGWKIKGAINGKAVTLLFASGSPSLLLTPEAIARLQLTPDEFLRDGSGNRPYLLDALKLDRFTLTQTPAGTTAGALGMPGVDGVFGLNLLRDFVVRLYPQNGWLEILAPETPPQQDNNTTPIYFDRGFPLVQVLVDGHGPLLMRLDTGVPAPALSREHLDELHLQTDGPLINSEHRFDFAGMSITMPRVPAYPISDGDLHHYGLIGAASLPLVFEIRASKGYLSYPTQVLLPPASAPGSRSGAGKPRTKPKPKPRP